MRPCCASHLIALLQRVLNARVEVGGETIGQIAAGLLVLVCAERGDELADCDALVRKVLRLRVFDDGHGRMNLSLTDTGGALLAVPQFTLAADTSSGTRPSFTRAADPKLARVFFDRFVEETRSLHQPVASGQFGAHMQVSLVNDGPVTLWLQTGKRRGTEKPLGQAP